MCVAHRTHPRPVPAGAGGGPYPQHAQQLAAPRAHHQARRRVSGRRRQHAPPPHGGRHECRLQRRRLVPRVLQGHQRSPRLQPRDARHQKPVHRPQEATVLCRQRHVNGTLRAVCC